MAIGEKVVTGTGTRSPNFACAATPSEVRSCGLASVRVSCVGLQQPVVQAGHVGQEDLRLAEVPQVLQRQALAVDVDRAVDARLSPATRSAGRTRCRRDAVHLEQLDVDDDLRHAPCRWRRAARAAAAIRSGVSWIVMALVAGGRRDAAGVDDDPQQVDRLLEIGVAQIERLDDLFLVLAALGRRVGNDGDGPRAPVTRKKVCVLRRDRRQGLFEGRVAEIDRHRRVAKGRIEHHVDAGEARERR